MLAALAALVAAEGEARSAAFAAVDGALRTSQLTQLYTQGVPSRLLPSPNAQHLFVVQTRPAAGSGQRLLHTFIGPELLPPVKAFIALGCDSTFTLAELGARHPFAQACAVRQLIALRAASLVDDEAAEVASRTAQLALQT